MSFKIVDGFTTERADIVFSQGSNAYQTSIEYSCPDSRFYFDYPIGNSSTSYYYTTNINAINVTCNKDG